MRHFARVSESKLERGQSLVELALMMTVLVLLLAGVLDLARAYYSYLALRDAAGEGAYYASIHPSWKTSADNPDPDNITYRVKNAAPSGGFVSFTAAAVTVTAPSISAGNYITVTVSTSYRIITAFIGGIVGSQTLPLSATSSAKILSPGP
ncbi:MAG: pilus assembly protein [Chloroflexi bacterium]|nr:pilus assembly protein [Chloroflexota bacterium]